MWPYFFFFHLIGFIVSRVSRVRYVKEITVKNYPNFWGNFIGMKTRLPHQTCNENFSVFEINKNEIYFWKILSESGGFTSKGLHGCTHPPETKLTRAYNWIIDVSKLNIYLYLYIESHQLGTWIFQLKNQKGFAMHFGVLNTNLLDWFQSQFNYLFFKVHMCFTYV